MKIFRILTLMFFLSPTLAADDKGFLAIIDEGLQVGQDWLKDGRDFTRLIKNSEKLNNMIYRNDKLSVSQSGLSERTINLANEYRLLAWNNAKNNKHIKAVKLYRESLEINANDARSWHGYGWSLAQLKLYDRAENSFMVALSIDRTKDETWRHLGWNFHRQNELKRARESYYEALFINPKNKRARYALDSLTAKKVAVKKTKHTYSIQVAAFGIKKNASEMAKKMKQDSLEVWVTSRDKKHFVMIGKYPSKNAAAKAKSNLKIEGSNSFLIKPI